MASQKIKLVLAAFAFAMTLSASLASSAKVFSNGVRTQDRPCQLEARRNPDLILFKRGSLNTRESRSLDNAIRSLRSSESSSVSSRLSTRVIQFGGPVKSEWIDRLRSAGVEIIGYIPNNAYVVRGGPVQLENAANLHGGDSVDDTRPIQWIGRLEPIQKIDPVFSDEMLVSRTTANVAVEIELADSPDALETIAKFTRLASTILHEPRRFLRFVVLSVTLPLSRLIEVAAFDDVLFIGPAAEPQPLDERSAQIVASNLTVDQTQPAAPGYWDWIRSLGLDSVPDFVIDIADSGLDRGLTSGGSVHPDLRDANGTSRVSYSFNYTIDGAQDQSGHGSLVASIVGGKGSSDYEDSLGYMYGLGVEPSASLGVSRIFDSRGRLPFQLSFTSVTAFAYAAGARIVNNSWGNGGNGYDAAAQEYDALVRDARPTMPGNQEMTFVFSAGNGGPGGHVSSPGTAKNVITVAASENYRPEGTDSCNLDGGGGIGPDGADSVLDILRYSSGGPTADFRSKPDLAAPGTHIYGGASQASPFFGDGLCPGVPLFQPPGQHFYTWSSGTSLSAPHVTGAAALLRKFVTSRQLLGAGQPPSPAMTKAFLINSATYLTGENAAGDLPDPRQGWGRVDLSRAFDNAHRFLLDQSTLFTETGQIYEVSGSLADRSLPLRVTLAWTDAIGTLAGPALVNDLDLEVKVGGVTVYRGNNFDGRWSIQGGEPDRFNNVESIFLPADAIPTGIAGNFTITVRAANIPGDGVPGNETSLDQDFALAIYNIDPAVVIDPPPNNVPVITGVTYVNKKLVISGRDFTGAAQVEINGKIIERPFEFDAAVNSLSLKLKYKKLNLKKETDNQIVLIERGGHSQPFVLRI
ncbi:MAG TPA: S8 family serine peptidase [Blastocatellia bacterium]|nr:S8 family serine peptidase [Blastocatellia bacterium]